MDVIENGDYIIGDWDFVFFGLGVLGVLGVLGNYVVRRSY